MCQWLLLLLLWVLWVWTTALDRRQHHRRPYQTHPIMHLVLKLMEEDGPPSPAGRASTDRELSLLLQNLHRAIDATSKGAAYSVSSAVHPSGGSLPGVTLPVSDPGVKFDKWLSRARLDKPTRFDGEGGDCDKAFLSELQRYLAATDLPLVSWGAVTPHFLAKSALLMWELEFQTIIVTHGPTAVTSVAACLCRAAYE